MKLKLWLANKYDRPNMLYRIIIGTYRSKVNPDTGVKWTGQNENIFTTSTVGNNLVRQLDPERFRAFKDIVVRNELGTSENSAGSGKECHKLLRFWIRRKKSKTITYDASGDILNNPLAVFVIPYDSKGTVVIDNIASCAFHARLYFKDA